MEKAEEIAKTMGIEDFTPSQGWFFRWKKRENIVFRKLHGEEKSADTVGAENWIRNEWPKIVAEYSPEDIYNADETGLNGQNRLTGPLRPFPRVVQLSGDYCKAFHTINVHQS